MKYEEALTWKGAICISHGWNTDEEKRQETDPRKKIRCKRNEQDCEHTVLGTQIINLFQIQKEAIPVEGR